VLHGVDYGARVDGPTLKAFIDLHQRTLYLTRAI